MDGSEPAPPELRLAWQCEHYKSLPDTGGVLDQEYRTVTLMTALSNIYNAYSRYRNASGKEIHNLTDSERRILRVLKDTGVLFRA